MLTHDSQRAAPSSCDVEKLDRGPDDDVAVWGAGRAHGHRRRRLLPNTSSLLLLQGELEARVVQGVVIGAQQWQRGSSLLCSMCRMA